MNNREKSTIHLFISGRVQGVFFRQFVKDRAQKLGLFGWVRNLADGRVEAIIEGDKEKLQEILIYIKKGPLLAKVEKIEIDWQEYQRKFKEFSIL
jgi:acylphosphatase